MKSETDIVKLACQCIQLADGGQDTNVTDDIGKAYKYYFGEKLGNEVSGRSDYVSRDVYDAVEDAKEILLEVFTGNRETIKFTPQGANDVLQSKLRTSYSNRVFHQFNNGYEILHDSIQDALLAKNCVAKVWWEEKTEYKRKTAESIAPEAYEALEASDIEVIEAVEDTETGLVDVEYDEPVDRSQVSVRVIPPERQVRDPNATCVKDARFWGEKTEVTRSELLEMGFDEDVVASLNAASDDDDEIEEFARAGVAALSDEDMGEESQDLLELYELFVWYDEDGDGRAELHQVFICNKKLLEQNEMRRMPYFDWAAMRVAHRYEGMSMYDILHDIQYLKSTIKRQIVDNLMITNNQSRIARAGAFANPAALLENEIGAVHWTKGGKNGYTGPLADAMMAEPAPQLSALTMPTLEILNQDKEHRAGVSRLTSGLNQDVINNQNADDLINRMTSSAMRRVMGMARRYAELFLIPIFQEIYTLALEHDKEGLEAEVDGEWQMLVPQQLGEYVDMEVSVALTPDDAESRARTLMVLHNSLAQTAAVDPSINTIYGPQNKYALLREVFNLSGQPMPEFLTDPQSGPGQMAQQLQQLGQQVQQLSMQNQQLTDTLQQYQQMGIEAKQQDANTRALKAQGDLELKAQKQAIDAELGKRKQSLAEDAEAHDQVIDDIEVTLERQQGRNVAI